MTFGRDVLKYAVESLSSAEALRQYRLLKTREKKKAEPLSNNVRFSAQKSRVLACATTTTVQTQEGEFVQWSTCHCRFHHGDKRSRAELGVAQGSDTQDWNYKILKIDQSLQLLDTEGKKVSFLIGPVCVALGHPYDIIPKKRSRPDPNSLFYTHPCSTLSDSMKVWVGVLLDYLNSDNFGIGNKMFSYVHPDWIISNAIKPTKVEWKA